MSSFRELLDEAIGPAPPSTIDIDRTMLRARRQVWIRPVVGAFVVAVLATAALAAASVADDRAAPPVAPVSPDLDLPLPFTPMPVDYFPEYMRGAEVVAEAWGPLSSRPVELTFLPNAPPEELTLLVRCDLGGVDLDLDLAVRLGPGMTHVVGGCDDGGEAWELWQLPGWEAFVSVRDLRTITLRVTGAELPPALADGTFGIAVGESVPFHDFPLPSAPSSLSPIDPEIEFDYPAGIPPPEVEGKLRADPDDPAAPRSLTIEWSRDLWFVARAQAPGRLYIEIDGMLAGPVTVWDYEQTDTGLDHVVGLNWVDSLERPPEPGQEVTVTVTPEYLTGDWVLFFLS